MHSRIYAVFSLMALLALPAACSIHANSNVVKPDWLTGESNNYPATRYVGTVGKHRFLKGAKDAAREELLHRFAFVAPPDLPLYLAHAKADIDIQSMLAPLDGKIQIVDTWLDKENGRYLAYAVLDKQLVADQITKIIVALDESTRDHIDRVGSSPDKLAKISHAGKALQAQVVRDFYTGIYKTVDTSERSALNVWQASSLRSDFEKLLHRITIKPVVVNDDSGALKSALSYSLQAGGFGVEEQGDADFIIESALYIKDREREAGGTRIKGQLTIRFLGSDRKEHGKHSWPLSYLASGELRDASAESLRQLFNSELLPLIVGFATDN